MNLHPRTRILACIVGLATLAMATNGIAYAEQPHQPTAAAVIRKLPYSDTQAVPTSDGTVQNIADSTRKATRESNLDQSDPSDSDAGGSQPDGVGGLLAEGQIVNGVHDIEDPATSIYVGGNMTYHNNVETEGSIVVDGNLSIERHMPESLLAGKVMWGMGFNPPAGADMITVGGEFRNHTGERPQWVSGSARFGGKVAWGDGRETDANGRRPLYLATHGNMTEMGWNADASQVKSWAYPDLPATAKIIHGLGKTEALRANIDGKGGIVDYNDYVDKTLRPLSRQLVSLSANGSISFEKAPDEDTHVFFDDYAVSIRDEGRIVFQGTGKPEKQVFLLDLDALKAAGTTYGVNQWSLDFRDLPDGQAIVINVSGSGERIWSPGWRIWVNGENHSTAINARGDSWSRFRDISSRIMWNYPDVSHLTLDYSHGTLNKDGYGVSAGGNVYGTVLGKGSLFPGSILLPNGDMTDYADTNGRLLIGGNLDFDVWEHHNAPWVGFDEPQRFTLLGSTRADASQASYAGDKAVHDTLTLRSASSNGQGTTIFDLQVTGLSLTLSYRSSSGNVSRSDPKTFTSATVPKSGSVITLKSPDFVPADLGLDSWMAGEYWFDVSGADIHIKDASKGVQSSLVRTASLDGSNNAAERFVISPDTLSLGLTTKANPNDASTENANTVTDTISLTNNGAVEILVRTIHITLNYPSSEGIIHSTKTVSDIRIPSQSVVKVDSPGFVPADLGFTGNWHQNLQEADRYWFDVAIDPANVVDASGAVVPLASSATHDGRTDLEEQFQVLAGIHQARTEAANTFRFAGGADAVHDSIIMEFDAVPSLQIVSTLNWCSDAEGVRAERSVAKNAMVQAQGTSKGPEFIPDNFGWDTWKAGRYWYDLTITDQQGVFGLKPLLGIDIDEEQWSAVEPPALPMTGIPYDMGRIALTCSGISAVAVAAGAMLASRKHHSNASRRKYRHSRQGVH